MVNGILEISVTYNQNQARVVASKEVEGGPPELCRYCNNIAGGQLILLTKQIQTKLKSFVVLFVWIFITILFVLELFSSLL